MDKNFCQCCGDRPADFAISYKPGDQVFKIPLCGRCFSTFKTNAGFLQKCLDEGPAGDYSRFFELRDDREAVNA